MRTRETEAGGTEYSGAAIIYSGIEQIVRGTESVRESSDSRICERVAGVCIHFIVYMLYIRRTLSCCICHVFRLVFSVYVHSMYIFLSLFLVDGFYCVVLLDIVLICCCTPDNDVDSPSPDMGRHTSLFFDIFE